MEKGNSQTQMENLFFCRLNKYILNITDYLNVPVDSKKIDELEEISEKKIPECFRNFYLEHNGEGEKIFGVMSGFKWMSIESVMVNWKSLQNSAYDITFEQDGMIQDGK